MIELECHGGAVKQCLQHNEVWTKEGQHSMCRDWLKLYDALEAAEKEHGELEDRIRDLERKNEALTFERNKAERKKRARIADLERQLAERGDVIKSVAKEIRANADAEDEHSPVVASWYRQWADRLDAPAKTEKPYRIEVKSVNNSGCLDYRWLIWVDERCELYGYANSYDQAYLDAQAVAARRWPEEKE